MIHLYVVDLSIHSRLTSFNNTVSSAHQFGEVLAEGSSGTLDLHVQIKKMRFPKDCYPVRKNCGMGLHCRTDMFIFCCFLLHRREWLFYEHGYNIYVYLSPDHKCRPSLHERVTVGLVGSFVV